MYRLLSCAAIAALSLGTGVASAATVTVDFDTGSLSGGVYTEDDFTFASNSPGGVSLSNDCGSKCLQLNNNETITVTYKNNGLFDLLSFAFRSPGNGGDLEITDNNGNSQTITENLNGNALQFISFPGQYNGILSFSWTNAENGSGRVDNVSFNISAVPLPAAGWLLLAGVGGLAALRRKRAV
jgi:hypothetical protein